jgi:hypothetical protein
MNMTEVTGEPQLGQMWSRRVTGAPADRAGVEQGSPESQSWVGRGAGLTSPRARAGTGSDRRAAARPDAQPGSHQPARRAVEPEATAEPRLGRMRSRGKPEP